MRAPFKFFMYFFSNAVFIVKKCFFQESIIIFFSGIFSKIFFFFFLDYIYKKSGHIRFHQSKYNSPQYTFLIITSQKLIYARKVALIIFPFGIGVCTRRHDNALKVLAVRDERKEK